MAAVRGMLSVVREEAAVLSAEMATTARTATVELSRTAEMEMNPNMIRQAVKASIQETAVGGEFLYPSSCVM
jgi:hypothetical protein